jgi:acetyltransferase
LNQFFSVNLRILNLRRKKEDKFGHFVLCGLGGIYIEVLKDVQASLAPISNEEALEMI